MRVLIDAAEFDSECLDDRCHVDCASTREYPPIKAAKFFRSGSVAPSNWGSKGLLRDMIQAERDAADLLETGYRFKGAETFGAPNSITFCSAAGCRSAITQISATSR
jgi:hypothetical protein